MESQQRPGVTISQRVPGGRYRRDSRDGDLLHRVRPS